MTEQEINNLIDSKIAKTKMSQLPEATQTSGLYSIGYTGNQSVKYKASLLQGDPLTVRKTYQTEAEALADKNPIDTTTSLPLTVGQFVSIIDDGEKNGIYRIGSISGDGTMSLELQGKLGDLSEYTKTGGSPKTLKQVDDEKADHGYASIEVSKTLKQVDDNASVKIENLVENGDFRNGTTGWSQVTVSGVTVTNGVASFTATNRYGRITRAYSAPIGSIVYMLARVKGADTVMVGAQKGASSVGLTGTGAFELISHRETIDIQSPLFTLQDLATSDWSEVSIDFAITINLTATFGEGNEPTKEEMNLLISTLGIDYFEGEITIPAQKIMQWQLKLVDTAAQNADDARLAIQDDLALKANHGEVDKKIRFLSGDFNCFQMYKDSKEEQSWVWQNETYKASDFYRSVIWMELYGFESSLPHKLSVIRRNSDNIQDYSIMISRYVDGAWERAAYFTKTNENIEVNPNGINLYEHESDGRTIRALIDYSYIKDGSNRPIMNIESSEPNFIIKPECFKDVVVDKLPYDEFLLDDDGFIKNSLMPFIGEGENKFNSEDIIKDYYIISTIGETTGQKYKYPTDNRAAISNDIKVPDGKTHIYTTGFSTNSSINPTFINCMDENKSFIGYTAYATVPKELPLGTKYVAVPLYRDETNDVLDPDWSDTMIAFTTGETIPYQEYKKIILPEYIDIDDIPEDLDIRINDIEQDIVQIKESVTEPFDMSKVIGNLPVSTDGTDIDSGYAYIEEGTNIIKVK